MGGAGKAWGEERRAGGLEYKRNGDRGARGGTIGGPTGGISVALAGDLCWGFSLGGSVAVVTPTVQRAGGYPVEVGPKWPDWAWKKRRTS